MTNALMSEISATVALKTQVALIKDEINQRKKEKNAILDTPREDLHHRYIPRSQPTFTLRAIYTLVSQKCWQLDEIYWNSDPFSEKVLQAKRSRILLSAVNQETRLMEIVEEVQSDIREYDRQIATIDSLFKKLAASLPFTLDIVGIVARYGI